MSNVTPSTYLPFNVLETMDHYCDEGIELGREIDSLLVGEYKKLSEDRDKSQKRNQRILDIFCDIKNLIEAIQDHRYTITQNPMPEPVVEFQASPDNAS